MPDGPTNLLGTIAAAVATAGAVAAWVGAVRSKKHEKEATVSAARSAEAAERLAAIEERRDREVEAASSRAALRLGLQDHRGKTALVLRNVGLGVATHISVRIEGKTIAEWGGLMGELPEREGDSLGPGGEARLRWVVLQGPDELRSPMRVAVTWTDGSGEGQTWSSSIG